MSKILKCPDCGRLVASAFPLHDCNEQNEVAARAVYWHRSNGDTVPSMILERRGTKVRLLANCREGDRKVWVQQKNISP